MILFTVKTHFLLFFIFISIYNFIDCRRLFDLALAHQFSAIEWIIVATNRQITSLGWSFAICCLFVQSQVMRARALSHSQSSSSLHDDDNELVLEKTIFALHFRFPFGKFFFSFWLCATALPFALQLAIECDDLKRTEDDDAQQWSVQPAKQDNRTLSFELKLHIAKMILGCSCLFTLFSVIAVCRMFGESLHHANEMHKLSRQNTFHSFESQLHLPRRHVAAATFICCAVSLDRIGQSENR